MDDLEFRRLLYVDPKTDNPDVQKAALEDPKKKQFIQELRKLDKKMARAAQVEVPADLASKLILRQTMQSHKANQKRSRIQLALAASVAFVVGVSFTMWQQSNLIGLSEHAIAHVIAEGDYALGANEDISVSQVNAKLASFGAELSGNIGQIYYANFCDFDDIRSLHMVMQVGGEKVTVFVVPHGENYDHSSINNNPKYNSQTVEHQRASLVVVGEAGSDVSKAKQTLSQKIKFSA